MAAETALAGKGGSVFVPGTPDVAISYIHTWSLTVTAENYDVSYLGDNWSHFIPGLRGWNGQIQGYYNVTNDATGQLLVHNALLSGSSVVLQMQTAPGGGWYEGSANITQFAISDPVNNVITLDFTFVGTGSLQHQP